MGVHFGNIFWIYGVIRGMDADHASRPVRFPVGLVASPQRFSQRGRSTSKVVEEVIHRNHRSAPGRDESSDGGIILPGLCLTWGRFRFSSVAKKIIEALKIWTSGI